MAARGAIRSALCWGDTSTPWDWAARLLTLSDGASTLLARDNESLNSLVKVDQLVFRTHGFALDRDHAALHGTTDEARVGVE